MRDEGGQRVGTAAGAAVFSCAEGPIKKRSRRISGGAGVERVFGAGEGCGVGGGIVEELADIVEGEGVFGIGRMVGRGEAFPEPVFEEGDVEDADAGENDWTAGGFEEADPGFSPAFVAHEQVAQNAGKGDGAVIARGQEGDGGGQVFGWAEPFAGQTAVEISGGEDDRAEIGGFRRVLGRIRGGVARLPDLTVSEQDHGLRENAGAHAVGDDVELAALGQRVLNL